MHNPLQNNMLLSAASVFAFLFFTHSLLKYKVDILIFAQGTKQ